jgi:hypothetical protein
MARKRKRKLTPTAATTTGWQWFTFPVFAAFTFGAATVLALQYAVGILLGLQIALYGVLAAMGFVLAHITTRILRTILIRQRAERLRAVQHQHPSQRSLPPAS